MPLSPSLPWPIYTRLFPRPHTINIELYTTDGRNLVNTQVRILWPFSPVHEASKIGNKPSWNSPFAREVSWFSQIGDCLAQMTVFHNTCCVYFTTLSLCVVFLLLLCTFSFECNMSLGISFLFLSIWCSRQLLYVDKSLFHYIWKYFCLYWKYVPAFFIDYFYANIPRLSLCILSQRLCVYHSHI